MSDSENFFDELRKWNQIIYENSSGQSIGNGMDAECFWDHFGIKSWPKFEDACAYHVPAKWSDEVKEMILAAQKELGHKVEFVQIKEKYCRLCVYYNTAYYYVEQRMSELIEECKQKLIKKGVHPNT